VTSPDGTLDGGIDEQDRDHTEDELAAAIAALLAAKAASAPWLDLVQGSISGIVQDYLRRSAYDMATAAGLSGTEAAQAAGEATTAVLGDIERHAASWLKISADDRAPPGGGPMDQDQAQEAAAIIARSLATYSRERVREGIAKRLGAEYKTWVTRGDTRVRPAHAELAGKTVRLDKPFSVQGSTLMRPGDPEAPPDLVIGCRCHLAYSVKPITASSVWLLAAEKLEQHWP